MMMMMTIMKKKEKKMMMIVALVAVVVPVGAGELPAVRASAARRGRGDGLAGPALISHPIDSPFSTRSRSTTALLDDCGRRWSLVLAVVTLLLNLVADR